IKKFVFQARFSTDALTGNGTKEEQGRNGAGTRGQDLGFGFFSQTTDSCPVRPHSYRRLTDACYFFTRMFCKRSVNHILQGRVESRHRPGGKSWREDDASSFGSGSSSGGRSSKSGRREGRPLPPFVASGGSRRAASTPGASGSTGSAEPPSCRCGSSRTPTQSRWPLPSRSPSPAAGLSVSALALIPRPWGAS